MHTWYWKGAQEILLQIKFALKKHVTQKKICVKKRWHTNFEIFHKFKFQRLTKRRSAKRKFSQITKYSS